jgi:hypothetical protein
LSSSEKADKVIALREALLVIFKEQANQISQLAISTFNTQTEVGSDQSRQKLTLLTRLSRLQKQTTEFSQSVAERIETVKRTGIA